MNQENKEKLREGEEKSVKITTSCRHTSLAEIIQGSRSENSL